MNIFDFRNLLIGDYASYIKSFIQIRDPQLNDFVQQKLEEGVLWPEPLIQLNPLFARGESIDELEKFLRIGYPNNRGPVTFERYTGQESDEERQRIIANPPDILLTNYVMLELILTRATERRMLASKMLQFLVLDELHTYRGRQGADVALLVRRVRDRLAAGTAGTAGELQCVGT